MFSYFFSFQLFLALEKATGKKDSPQGLFCIVSGIFDHIKLSDVKQMFVFFHKEKLRQKCEHLLLKKSVWAKPLQNSY